MKKENTKKTFIVKVGVKHYELNIFDTSEKDEIFIECTGANLNQLYLKNDLPILLEDISGLIEEHQLEKKDSTFQIRLTAKQKMLLENNTNKAGYNNISDFIKKQCELV